MACAIAKLWRIARFRPISQDHIGSVDEEDFETMRADKNEPLPDPGPRRVAPVEPDLLGSAIFIYSEYLRALEEDARLEDNDEDDAPKIPEVDMRAFLDLLSEELGTDVATTLNLYMRLTALHRLLETHPALGRLVIDEDGPSGFLTEDALVAAARLELIVRGIGDERGADFDAREFRSALDGLSDEGE